MEVKNHECRKERETMMFLISVLVLLMLSELITIDEDDKSAK
jgi:hypothetical protein